MRSSPAPLLAALYAILAAFSLTPPAVARDWLPAERVETYAISGATGIELYRSIGERGPKIGLARTIAHTGFDLLWSRDYRPQADGSCILASARPSLTITYTLPAAPSGLSPEVATRWQRFRDGIAAHERAHGQHVIEMTERIATFSTGLSASDDPDCNKVRGKLQTFLAEVAAWRLSRAQEFDREEMGDGGNVHTLILELVNP